MKGFTLVELIVSIAIFAAMTALVIAKYGSFNQNTILTNMAYDMALTVRTAQTYGLSVKSTDASSSAFGSAYGIHFDIAQPTKYVFFADTNSSGLGANMYDPSDQTITIYTLTQGAKISSICLGSDPASCSSATTLDVLYKRPNPNALFKKDSSNDPSPAAFIKIQSSDGTKIETVYIRRNGQISVGN